MGSPMRSPIKLFSRMCKTCQNRKDHQTSTLIESPPGRKCVRTTSWLFEVLLEAVRHRNNEQVEEKTECGETDDDASDSFIDQEESGEGITGGGGT